MARKKPRRQRHIRIAPCFVFTPETITLLEKAIALFEMPLTRADHQREQVVFAEETVQRVKAKLVSMKQSVGEICLTTFDYNEKIVVRHALLLYSIDLLEASPGAQQAWELRQCRRISMYFTNEGKALP